MDPTRFDRPRACALRPRTRRDGCSACWPPSPSLAGCLASSPLRRPRLRDDASGARKPTSTARAASVRNRKHKKKKPQCTPTTCAAQGKTCGSIADGCGKTLDCGPCCILPTDTGATKGLQEAIDQAATGDTITLCAGTWELTSTVVIPENLTLTLSGAGDDKTVLDGGMNLSNRTGGVRVLQIAQGATLALQGLRITRGNANNQNNQFMGSGGGILHEGQTLTLTDCALGANTAFTGGGLSVPGGSPTRSVEMTRCTIDENTGGTLQFCKGGGLFNGATATLRDCDVAVNLSYFGGGINNEGTLTLDTSMVGGSNSALQGGGIYNTGTLELNDTTVQRQQPGKRGWRHLRYESRRRDAEWRHGGLRQYRRAMHGVHGSQVSERLSMTRPTWRNEAPGPVVTAAALVRSSPGRT